VARSFHIKNINFGLHATASSCAKTHPRLNEP